MGFLEQVRALAKSAKDDIVDAVTGTKQVIVLYKVEDVLKQARELNGSQELHFVGYDTGARRNVTVKILAFTDHHQEQGRRNLHRYNVRSVDANGTTVDQWLHIEQVRDLLGRYNQRPMSQLQIAASDRPSGQPRQEFAYTLTELMPGASEDEIRELMEIVATFNHAGFPVYVVGGALRDIMLGIRPKDIDLATPATPDQVRAVAAGRFRVSESQGGSYAGVLGINDYDFATLRAEADYSDRKNPTYTFTTDIHEDQQRRDFTINGGAAEIKPDGTLVLIDSIGFMADILENRVVRCIRDPYMRLKEDPVRILRAVTVSASTGLPIEAQTETAIRELAGALATIPQEHLGVELAKMVNRRIFHRGLAILRDLGLLPYTMPEIAHQVGLPQNPAYHHLDVFDHTVAVLRAAEESNAPLPVRLAAVFHDAAKGLDGIRKPNKSGQPSDLGHEEAGVPVAYDGVLRLQFRKDVAERAALLVHFHGVRSAPTAKSVVKALNQMRQSLSGEELKQQTKAIEEQFTTARLAKDLTLRSLSLSWNFGNRETLRAFVDDLFSLMKADAAGFAPHFRSEQEQTLTALRPVFNWVLEHIPFYTKDVPGITEIPKAEGLKGPDIRKRLLELIKDAQDDRKRIWSPGLAAE